MCLKICQISWAMALITLTATKSEDIPDVTLISYKRDATYHMSCVANGNTDSAIAWIDREPANDDVVKLVSVYIPARNSPYNCDINFESETCNIYWSGRNTIWTLQTSLDGLLRPVTDRRWEEFKTHYTSGENKFQTIAYINKNDFAVHISVRIEKDAQIYLCDDEYPPRGHCYWILLGGFGGNSTAIRKCTNEKVPKTGYPKKDCRKNQDMVQHNPSNPILNGMEWRHFTIEKRGSNILLWQVGENKPVLNYTDEDTLIRTPYLSIKSHETPGYWKVHDYAYTFASIQGTTILGDAMYVEKNNFCITMFVAMCDQCILILYLTNFNNNYRIWTTTVTPKQRMVWQEEKFIVEILDIPKHVQLHVTLECSSGDCENPFWAIDSFQICSKNEVRVISADQERDIVSCQVIKHPHLHMVQTEVQTDNFPERNCPYGSFGKSCIDCSKVVGSNKVYCEASIICDRDSYGRSICRCAAGYEGASCERECPRNLYGFGCKEKCGYCEYAPCNYITGNCAPHRCANGFTGLRCRTPPLPVLLNPPTVVDSGHTYFTVEIQNNSYEGNGIAASYRIQYKEESQTRSAWKQSDNYYYDNTSPITMNNLNILTTYRVRAILYTANGQAYAGEYVPNTTAYTTCAIIEQNNIKIERSNTTATVIFEYNNESCRSEDYEILLVGRKEIVTSENFVFNIRNLKPDTTYDLTITNKNAKLFLEKKFTTMEGAPESVEQLVVTNPGSTSLSISWKPPKVPNGKIKYYNIQYKHVKYLACEQNANEDSISSIREESTSHVINNLHPYSQYSIEVVAATVVNGKPRTIPAYTLQTDLPEESEIPVIKEIKPNSTTATVILQQPNCMLIKGPIEYYVKAECSNSWCSQGAEDIFYANNNPIILSGLQPFSKYTVKIKVKRKDGNVFDGPEITNFFHTTTSVPHLITTITAYSKNENSISLRFLPPYPPTGVVEQYYFKYCYKISTWGGLSSDYNCMDGYVVPSICKLWSDFHCVTLQRLKSKETYIITVAAKNVGTNYGNAKSIEVRTIQETPGILENLTCKWDEYYNLTLTWGHPSITNGPLTNFIVTVSSKHNICNTTSFPISENNYNITYSFTIPFHNCYSSNLTIRAAAYNIKEGPPIIRNVLSPPRTPLFSQKPFPETITNTTITINLPQPEQLMNSSAMYVIVTNTNADSKYTNNVEMISEICDKLNVPNNAFSWIAAEYDFTKVEAVQRTLVIGDGTKTKSTRLNKELHNEILHNDVSYIVTTTIINEFGGFKRCSVIEINARTSTGQPDEQKQSSNYGLFALLLLLIVPVILFIFIRIKKRGGASWLTMPNVNINLAQRSPNPDVIPLETSKEKKPGKVITQSQLRPKRKIPTDKDVSLTQPSTSTSSKEFSKPVAIIDFEEYVKESIENGELQKQHQLFRRGQTKPWDYGLLPQNKSKNRYNNLIAYDHTRVKLAKMNNDPYSDYINANYIEGYNSKKAYIATQGPKAATVNDFWRMIWQENVNHIIMLANVLEGGKKKTEQYWPNVNECLEFGNIKVEYVSSRVFADYEYRTFSVSSNNDERKVEQLHFTSWPDHAVPLYSQSLVPFLRKILTISQGSSPIVVHCSAGVGRTGTIILCDLCLRMAAREGIVDILKHQHNLREQRANLVDNIEQYKLAHLVLLECLVAPQTSVRCDKEMEGEISGLLESERVAQQMLYLHETAWQDQAMRPPLIVTNIPEWSTKIRIQDIIPCGYGRVYLSRYPITDEHSDYINAVEVDGFRTPQRFIVTQQPLPHTISDFWRMIDEKDVTTIVSLNKINLGDETSCVFWPTAKASEIQPVPFLTLQFHNKSTTDHYSIITVHLHNKTDKKNAKRTVSLIILKGWSANKLLPEEEESLLKLWEETERTSRGNNPIVVTCYDGAKACGLFIALSFVVEKMKLEQECDVCLAVRTVRHNRKQFVTEIDQFRYLYRAAIRYLSCFDLYSNFTPAGKK